MHPPEVVVSCGDPQGIGPEVSLAGALLFLEREPRARITLVGPRRFLLAQAERSGLGLHGMPPLPGRPALLEVEDPEAELPPPPSAAGGALALRSLQAAFRRVREDPRGRVLVTAPLSKEAVARTLPGFRGHTDWLAEACGLDEEEATMLFLAEDLRVALGTVHLPLAHVPAALSVDLLLRRLRCLRAFGRRHLGLPEPRVAVLALNPHAGEGGLLGGEEIEIIAPALRAFAAEGGRASGPHGADVFFSSPPAREADFVLAMYHDQGLLPVKLQSFGRAVNVTAGLPIVRTSVDHGCAFDIAGRGLARADAMAEAIRTAVALLPSS